MSYRRQYIWRGRGAIRGGSPFRVEVIAKDRKQAEKETRKALKNRMGGRDPGLTYLDWKKVQQVDAKNESAVVDFEDV